MDVDKLNVYLRIPLYILSIKALMTSFLCGSIARVAGVQNHDEKTERSRVFRDVKRRSYHGHPSPLVRPRASDLGQQKMPQSSFPALAFSSSFAGTDLDAGITLFNGASRVENTVRLNTKVVIFG